MKAENGNVFTTPKTTEDDMLKASAFIPKGATIVSISHGETFAQTRTVYLMEIIYRENGQLFKAKIKRHKTGKWRN